MYQGKDGREREEDGGIKGRREADKQTDRQKGWVGETDRNGEERKTGREKERGRERDRERKR